MKYIKTAQFLSAILLIYYLTYNTCFGWNKLPESDLEKLFDYVFSVGLYIVAILYLLPLFSVYERFIERNDK